MATLFGALDLAAQAVQEAVFASSWRHVPRRRAPDVNRGYITDDTRTDALFTGIYSERDVPMQVVHAWDVHTDTRPGLSAHKHTVEIDLRRFAYDVRVGDIIERQDDMSRWTIVSTDPDADGRLLLNVERLV